MEKLTQTWGERFAREAKGLVARHQPRVPSVEWLGPFVRRVSPRPPPTTRFARVEPKAPQTEVPQLETGELIPADVRERLREIIGVSLDQARVHTEPAADAFARSRNADAVTVGSDMLFRDGQYRPHEPQGFALLAHEGTHVVASASDYAMRATDAGAAAEESRARFAEVRAAAHPASLPGRAAPSPIAGAAAPSHGAPRGAAGAAPALATRPMDAASDRTTPVPASGPAFDVNELKRSIYRDLLQTIRSDAERGG